MSNFAVYNGQTIAAVAQPLPLVGASCADNLGNTFFAQSYSTNTVDSNVAGQHIFKTNKNNPFIPIACYKRLPPSFYVNNIVQSPASELFYYASSYPSYVGTIDNNYNLTPLYELDGLVYGLFFDGTKMYIYGSFTQITDVQTSYTTVTGSVALVDAGVITPMSFTISGEIYSLAVFQDSLYVSGYDLYASNNVDTLSPTAMYDGASWIILDPLPGNTIGTNSFSFFAVTDTTIYITAGDTTGNTCLWTDDGTGNPVAVGDMAADGFTQNLNYNSYLGSSAIFLYNDIPHISVMCNVDGNTSLTVHMLKYENNSWQAVGSATTEPDTDEIGYLNQPLVHAGTIYATTGYGYLYRLHDNIWQHAVQDPAFRVGKFGNYKYVYNNQIHTENDILISATPTGATVDLNNLCNTKSSSTYNNFFAKDSQSKLYLVGTDYANQLILQSPTPTPTDSPTWLFNYFSDVYVGSPEQPIPIIAPIGTASGFVIDENDDLYVVYTDTGSWYTAVKYNSLTNTWDSLLPAPEGIRCDNFIVEGGDLLFVGKYTTDTINLSGTYGIFRLSNGVVTSEGSLSNYDVVNYAAYGILRRNSFGQLYAAGEFFNISSNDFVPLITLDSGTWVDVSPAGSLGTVSGFEIDSTNQMYVATYQGVYAWSGIALDPIPTTSVCSFNSGWPIKIAIDNDQLYIAANFPNAKLLTIESGNLVEICPLMESVEDIIDVEVHPLYGVLVLPRYSDIIWQNVPNLTTPGSFVGVVDSMVYFNDKLYLTARDGHLSGVDGGTDGAALYTYDPLIDTWSRLALLQSSSYPYILHTDSNKLYLAGRFTTIDCVAVNNIAVFENGVWTAVGDDTILNNKFITNISKHGNTLYVSIENGGGGEYD